MSETRISNDGTDVVYRMPPWVADELASVLITAATRYATGKPRDPESYDRGWLEDAATLMYEAELVLDAALGEQ